MFREVMASVGMFGCALLVTVGVGYLAWRKFHGNQDQRPAGDEGASRQAPDLRAPLLNPGVGPAERTTPEDGEIPVPVPRRGRYQIIGGLL